MAMRMALFITIFCDSQYVVDVVRNSARRWQSKVYHKLDNADLIYAIDAQLQRRPAGAVQIQKVKAHIDILPTTGHFQTWIIEGNKGADEAAKLANNFGQPLLFFQRRSLVDYVQDKRRRQEDFGTTSL